MDIKLETRVQQYLNRSAEVSGEAYLLEEGRKYGRVVGYRQNGGGRHCVAFIDLTTGDVIKAATWKAPQKNADGTMSVRYNLLDDRSFEILLTVLDPYGSYLYKDFDAEAAYFIKVGQTLQARATEE